GSRPNDTSTAGAPVRPATPEGKRGETVAEDPKKAPPPKPPVGLPGVSAPSTVDYENHLKWNPKDDKVLRKYEDNPDVATGAGAVLPPVKWEFKEWPPSVPQNLYVYGITRFLMVMLHPAMVSERELTEYLIEMGYTARYAASATVGEKKLERMTKTVMDDVGPMIDALPAKPKGDAAQRVYLDLLTHYPYETGFGAWILSQPSEVTMPILFDIIKKERHPFLVRNAVFILRCFNNPEVVPVLRNLLLKTPDKVIRNRALAALVRWQDEEIVEWLCKQLGGADVPFRSYVLWALGRIGSPAAVEKVIAATKAFANDREFLWAALPALGWIGEKALGDKKKKVEEFLIALRPALATIPDPTPYDGQYTAVRAPDPANVTPKLLEQRLVMALARTGHAQSRDAVKG
ncbi:MAG: HEAT repeat domain-containing protein, partial [Candidatus Rokuibacteriota bacterium]